MGYRRVSPRSPGPLSPGLTAPPRFHRTSSSCPALLSQAAHRGQQPLDTQLHHQVVAVSRDLSEAFLMRSIVPCQLHRPDRRSTRSSRRGPTRPSSSSSEIVRMRHAVSGVCELRARTRSRSLLSSAARNGGRSRSRSARRDGHARANPGELTEHRGDGLRHDRVVRCRSIAHMLLGVRRDPSCGRCKETPFAFQHLRRQRLVRSITLPGWPYRAPLVPVCLQLLEASLNMSDFISDHAPTLDCAGLCGPGQYALSWRRTNVDVSASRVDVPPATFRVPSLVGCAA